MSQTGAKYAESIGKTHQEILAFYFPGCVISNDYGIGAPVIPGPVVSPSVLYLAKIETRKPAGLFLWKDPEKSAYAYNQAILKGSTVSVLTPPVRGFVLARYEGKEGYVDNQYLRKIADIPPPVLDPSTKTVKTRFGGGIGIWDSPNKTRRFVQIPDGTKVKIVKSVDSRWAQVEYLQYKGYADKNYLV